MTFGTMIEQTFHQQQLEQNASATKKKGAMNYCKEQVLQKENLFNVCCVVTRYFGGILLGAGGLVRAYTKGAKIAIDAAGKSMKRVWSVLYLPCPYTFYERVKLEVAAFEGIIRDTQFGAEVELELLFPENQAEPFLERLTDMTAATVEGMETGKEYRAFPVDNNT